MIKTDKKDKLMLNTFNPNPFSSHLAEGELEGGRKLFRAYIKVPYPFNNARDGFSLPLILLALVEAGKN